MNTFISSIFTKFITAIISILCLFNIVPNTNFELPPMYDPIPVVEEANENANYNNIPEFINDENINKETNETTPYNEETGDDANIDNNIIHDAFNIINDTHKENNGSDTEPVDEKPDDVAQPTDENANNDVQPADDNTDNGYEVLEKINISATEEDNLTLTLYSADTEAGSATLSAASTRNAAAPRKLTASATRAVTYSANELSTDDEEKAIVETKPSLTRTYSEGPESVIAVISGSGKMEENVYRHFVSVDNYIATITALIAAEYDLDVNQIECVVPEGVTDIIQVDAEIMFFALVDCEEGPAGTELAINDNIRDLINPEDILAYSPNSIDFAEDSNVTSISEGAFLFCKDLDKVVIPNTVKTIGKNAFSYCSNLTEVTLPDQLEVIGEGAFMQCRSLEKIELPSTVKRIEAGAFAFCSNLSEVVLNDGLEFVGDNAFLNIKEGSTILCPTESVYKLANSRYVITRGRTLVVNTAK